MQVEKENIVEVRNITAGYNGSVVLENVSMDAPKQDITVILGFKRLW